MNYLEIHTRFIPIRARNDDDYIVLEITLTNHADEPKLLSVDVVTPYEQLAVDPYLVRKRGMLKFGKLKPGESVTKYAKIYLAKPSVKPGLYKIKVVANEHFLDYDKYLDKISFYVDLRVV